MTERQTPGDTRPEFSLTSPVGAQVRGLCPGPFPTRTDLSPGKLAVNPEIVVDLLHNRPQLLFVAPLALGALGTGA